MDASTREKHRIAGLNGEAMKAFRHAACRDLPFEFLARGSSLQTDEQFRARICMGNVPHLRFRLTAERGRLVWGRMHLKRESFPSIQNFDQHRKSFGSASAFAEQFGGMVFH